MFRKPLAIAVCAMACTPAFGFFGKGGDKLEQLQQQAPADTFFYVDSKTAKKDIKALEAYYSSQFRSIETQLAPLGELMGDAESPTAKFLTSVVKQLSDEGEQGLLAFMKTFKMGKEPHSAFYMDGVFPVIRLSGDSPKPWKALLDQAAKDSGIKPLSREVKGGIINGYPIWTNPETNIEYFLGFSQAKGLVTLAIYSSVDAEAEVTERFGFIAPKKSVASELNMQKLKSDYGFTDISAGYVSWETIFLSILDGNSRLVKQLETHLPETKGKFDQKEEDKICTAEAKEILANYPGMVMGATGLEHDKGTSTLKTGIVIEMKDTSVTSELKKLNGHLTSGNVVNDALLSLSLGVNLDNLTPVVTNLWNRMAQAEVKCEHLVEIQNSIKAANPAAIVMATAMAQGVKGVSLNLLGFSNDAKTNQPAIDVLATISAENPQVLAALISSLPQLGGMVTVPTDGTMAEIPLPISPSPLKVGISGKNLVIATGPKSETAAASLAKEVLNTNGFLGFKADYTGLSHHREDLLKTAAGTAPMEEESCVRIYESLAQFEGLSGGAELASNFSDKGWRFDLDTIIDTENLPAVPGPFHGDYRVASLGYGCEWEDLGTETIKADGTGSYAVPSEDDACEVYRAEYKWEKVLGVMIVTETKSQEKESCEQEWQDSQPEAYTCSLLSQNEQGFSCVTSSEDGYRSIYRYERVAK